MTAVIGRVVLIQVQRQPLTGGGVYDPGPLLEVEELRVSAQGVLGRIDESWIVDTHHAAHPRVRGRGLRGVSMGMTSHYAAMAERYGDVPVGIAGENIIVATTRRWEEHELGGGVVFRSPSGAGLEFPAARVASPCLEFTSYLLGLPQRAARQDVAADLEFLDGGTRGYLIDASRIRTPAAVCLGDEVHAMADSSEVHVNKGT